MSGARPAHRITVMMRLSLIVAFALAACRFDFDPLVDAGPTANSPPTGQGHGIGSGSNTQSIECGVAPTCEVDCRGDSSCVVDCGSAASCTVQCPATGCVVTSCMAPTCTVTCGDDGLASYNSAGGMSWATCL